MFYITLLLLLVTGVADAIAQGSMYGLASLFPPLYRQAIQNGYEINKMHNNYNNLILY